jgi:hypothetical protein
MTGLLAVAPAFADSPKDDAAAPPAAPSAPSVPSSPKDQAILGLDLLLKAMGGMLSQFPYYAAPKIMPNGDIVIRRLEPTPPADSTTPPATPAPDSRT